MELLGTIQYNVTADTTGVDASAAAIDNMEAKAKQAGAATDQLGVKISGTSDRAKKAAGAYDLMMSSMQRQIDGYHRMGRAAQVEYDIMSGALKSFTEKQQRALYEQAKAVDASTKSIRGLRGQAQNLGWQLQDTIVQIQMGTSAFTVFSQQGSQLISTMGKNGPLLGAIVAVGGVIGGLLFKSLMDTSTAMEEMSDRAKELSKDMDDLTEAQQKVIQAAMGYSIKEQEEAIADLKETIADYKSDIADLNAEHGKVVKITNQLGQTFGVMVDNTNQIAAATEKQIALETLLIDKEQALAKYKGEGNDKDKDRLTASQRLIQSLEDEQAKLSLTGAAMAKYLADKAKATDEERALIDMLVVGNEIRKEIEKVNAENAREQEQRDRKAREAEERRLESLKKLNDAMQKEASLFLSTSKEAEILYDIKEGLIQVNGGLLGSEAQLLLANARAVDKTREQLDYIEKLKDWVKEKRAEEKAVQDLITSLEKEQAILGATADEYRVIELRAQGATEAQIKQIMALEKSNKATRDQLKQTEKMFDRIDEAAANIWVDFLEGGTSAWDIIRKLGIQTLAELAHQALTKPIIMNVQTALSGKGGGGGGAGGLLAGVGQGGVYGLVAAAVVAGVSSWNKAQDAKFEKMTAAYRQGTQSMGTLLGSANSKSDSIAQAIDALSSVNRNVLDVNYGMLRALEAIEGGINGVAAGFARQFSLAGGIGDFSGIEGTQYFKRLGDHKTINDISERYNKIVSFGNSTVANFVTDFANGIMNGINKNIYSKKTRVIDTGIGLVGQSLADILSTGTLDAFAYAEVQTKKKVIGVTTSNKVKTLKEEMDAILLGQFADIFTGAADALDQASALFGLNFDDYLSQLIIDPQKLSLKGLEGDALVTEIEAFFSSTLDKWASVLLLGTGTLEKFQEVGEGAFETIIRLATELNTFNRYADLINVTFSTTGVEAVEASQAMADVAGGMEELSGAMGSFYDKFLTDTEKLEEQAKLLGDALAPFGVSLPENRDAWRDVIQGIDLATASGQKQFASLILYTDAVDGYLSALEKEKKAKDDLYKSAVDSAYAALTRSVDAQKRILDSQISVVNKSLDVSRAVYSSLESALSGMVVDAVQLQAVSRRQAQAQLGGFLQAARGGQLPELSALNSALSVVSKPSERLYSTFEEYMLDFDRTAAVIKQLQDVTGSQVTTEERTLAELEKQTAFLDEVAEWARVQVEVFNGVDTSMRSVAESVSLLADLLGVQYPSIGQQNTLADISRAAEQSRTNAAENMAKIEENNKMTQEQTKEFNEYMRKAQLALVDNTLQTAKILDKMDRVGVLIRDESMTVLVSTTETAASDIVTAIEGA